MCITKASPYVVTTPRSMHTDRKQSKLYNYYLLRDVLLKAGAADWLHSIGLMKRKVIAEGKESPMAPILCSHLAASLLNM